MCIESRRFGRNNQAPFSLIHGRSGRPIVNSPQKIIKISNKCMIRVSNGVSHVCLKSTLISNAQTMLEHCQALDTFVGDNVIQRTNQFSHKISSIQIPTTQVVIH